MFDDRADVRDARLLGLTDEEVLGVDVADACFVAE